MEALQQRDEVELEIAAFQGPHIKRARIVLVAIGILYAVVGYLNYDDIAELERAIGEGGASDHLRSAVDIAYGAVIFLIAAGITNIVLAILAGKHTMICFYIAMTIFIAHTGLQLYLGGGTIFSNVLWWLTAICLGMGFQAALKAQRLRKERRTI